MTIKINKQTVNETHKNTYLKCRNVYCFEFLIHARKHAQNISAPPQKKQRKCCRKCINNPNSMGKKQYK